MLSLLIHTVYICLYLYCLYSFICVTCTNNTMTNSLYVQKTYLAIKPFLIPIAIYCTSVECVHQV